MMMKATICAAAAAGFLALAAPSAAQAAMPVNAPASTAASGLVQPVGWHYGRWHHYRRWHHRRVCWWSRRVHWRHGRRVVTRVRHCRWR